MQKWIQNQIQNRIQNRIQNELLLFILLKNPFEERNFSEFLTKNGKFNIQ